MNILSGEIRTDLLGVTSFQKQCKIFNIRRTKIVEMLPWKLKSKLKVRFSE